MSFDKKHHFSELNNFLSQENLLVRLIFIVKVKDEADNILYNFKQITIEEDLQKALIKKFKQRMNGIHIKIDSINFEEYEPLNKSSNRKYKPISSSNSIINTLLESEIEIIKKMASELYRSIDGNAIIISDGEKNFISFRKLNQKTNFLQYKDSFFFREGTLKKLNKNVFKFDYNTDFYWANDVMVLVKDSYFNKLFGFDGEFEKSADSMLGNISKDFDFKIKGFDEFKQHCMENHNMIKKLHNIKSKDTAIGLNFEEVKELKKEFNLPFKVNNTSKEISTTSYIDIWSILNVFDDNYLESPRTKRKYEVHSKTRKG